MYDTICSQNCQICQFSVINEYFFGIKKYRQITDNNCIVLEKIDIINNEIAGLFGDKSSHIDNCLFSKIFSTALLKNAAGKVNVGLVACEDTFLNYCCLTSPILKKIYVKNSVYYHHMHGTGITSTDRFGNQLFEEYNIIKPLIDQYYRDNG